MLHRDLKPQVEQAVCTDSGSADVQQVCAVNLLTLPFARGCWSTNCQHGVHVCSHLSSPSEQTSWGPGEQDSHRLTHYADWETEKLQYCIEKRTFFRKQVLLCTEKWIYVSRNVCFTVYIYSDFNICNMLRCSVALLSIFH